MIAPPIQTVIETETHKDAPPPPPPPPTFERPPVEIPPTDTIVEMPVAQTTTAISNTTTQHVAPAAPKPPGREDATAGSARASPTREDYYPPASKRLGEEGAPTVKVCIGAGGKLTEPPTIAQSSGSARLDEGALNLVKAGARYIQPGTEDGKPIDSCFEFRIKFQMTK